LVALATLLPPLSASLVSLLAPLDNVLLLPLLRARSVALAIPPLPPFANLASLPALLEPVLASPRLLLSLLPATQPAAPSALLVLPPAKAWALPAPAVPTSPPPLLSPPLATPARLPSALPALLPARAWALPPLLATTSPRLPLFRPLATPTQRLSVVLESLRARVKVRPPRLATTSPPRRRTVPLVTPTPLLSVPMAQTATASTLRHPRALLHQPSHPRPQVQLVSPSRPLCPFTTMHSLILHPTGTPNVNIAYCNTVQPTGSAGAANKPMSLYYGPANNGDVPNRAQYGRRRGLWQLQDCL